MDLETFMILERRRLLDERLRLSARQKPASADGETRMQVAESVQSCPAENILNNANSQVRQCNYQHVENVEHTESARSTQSSTITTTTNALLEKPTPIGDNKKPTFSLHTQGAAELACENASPSTIHTNVELLKNAKDWVNHNEVQGKVLKEHNIEPKEQSSPSIRNSKLLQRRNADDMEQWVSDTFYSYFPAYNNEYQKRQNYLRERQRENQQNFLKHTQLSELSKAAKQATQTAQRNLNTARSTASSASHATDKTEHEIIVNNPNYVPPKLASNTRPGSTRHKLLQDLQHTELSGIIGGDGVLARNQHFAEVETARKKQYQRELMQQIEEKRRSIELLREKDRRQDEVLTQRLQEQLKTIHLEEQLEKEKMRADKILFDAEQSRLMRVQLLAKLENDAKMLYDNKNNNNKSSHSDQKRLPQNRIDNAAKNNKSNNNTNNENKVYKYFSNSARHEYRRGQPLPAGVEFDLEIPDTAANTERECFHLSEKVCPLCEEPLKAYESYCLRCQKQLSIKMPASKADDSERSTQQATTKSLPGESAKAAAEKEDERAAKQANVDESSAAHDDSDELRCSFSLVCVKCERMYALCPTCVQKSDVCRACHRKRNVCMNCRRTLCTFCLEEIARGRDTERTHINELDEHEKQQLQRQGRQCRGKSDTDSQRSFQVLEVNYTARHKESDDTELSSPPIQTSATKRNNNNVAYKQIRNDLHSERSHVPYSMNIERNSIFHPDYDPPVKPSVSFEQLPRIADKTLSFDLDLDDTSQTDEQTHIERMRKETDKRLSRYLKNYGDLAKHHNQKPQQQQERSKSESSRNRATQTTPNTAARRDIVLHEEHNLSMPLLREMPKMTRMESSATQNLLANVAAQKERSKMGNLKRRWEVPAIQKFTISQNSPRVLTQVGAIRKQLQADRLLLDDDDEDDDY